MRNTVATNAGEKKRRTIQADHMPFYLLDTQRLEITHPKIYFYTLPGMGKREFFSSNLYRNVVGRPVVPYACQTPHCNLSRKEKLLLKLQERKRSSLLFATLRDTLQRQSMLRPPCKLTRVVALQVAAKNCFAWQDP